MGKLFFKPPFRQLRSIFDYFWYFEVGLSRRPWLTLGLYLAIVTLTVLTAILGPRVWAISSYWSGLIIIAGMAVRYLAAKMSSNRAGALEMSTNADLSARSQFLDPASSDEKAGFRNARPPDGFDGAVHLSDDMNTQTFQQDAWDCQLVVDQINARQDAVKQGIRANARLFKAYGLQKTLSQFLKKALINEKKLGISSDLSAEMTEIKVFQTDYYTTLCAGEASLTDFSAKDGATKRVVNHSSTRVPYNLTERTATLNPLSSGRTPMTNQVGVSLLGITKDNRLAVCTQAKGALRGAGKRVPLATGSADWGDFEEGDSIKKFVERATLRELIEEWGNNKKLRKSLPLNWVDIVHLGSFRIPRRGGKPEFAVLAKLNWTLDQLTADTSEVEKYVSAVRPSNTEVDFQIDSSGDLVEAVETLLHRRADVNDSTSLLGCLLCLKSATEANLDRVEALLVSGEA